jgi:hypothetical protein
VLFPIGCQSRMFLVCCRRLVEQREKGEEGKL